jgi:hypothetical protein
VPAPQVALLPVVPASRRNRDVLAFGHGLVGASSSPAAMSTLTSPRSNTGINVCPPLRCARGRERTAGAVAACRRERPDSVWGHAAREVARPAACRPSSRGFHHDMRRSAGA